MSRSVLGLYDRDIKLGLRNYYIELRLHNYHVMIM